MTADKLFVFAINRDERIVWVTTADRWASKKLVNCKRVRVPEGKPLPGGIGDEWKP